MRGGADLLAQVPECQLERLARLGDREHGDFSEILVGADHGG